MQSSQPSCKEYLLTFKKMFSDQPDFNVINPATGSVICSVPAMDDNTIKSIINNTHRGFNEWKWLSNNDRANRLEHWAELLLTQLEVLAHLLTQEQGKPIDEARNEIRWGIDSIRLNAAAARSIHGYSQPFAGPNRESFVLKEPYGLVAAITPWNYPPGISLGVVSAGLAAGNTMLIKPAEDTPLTVTVCMLLAQQANIPKDVIGLITTPNPDRAGKIFCEDPHIGLLSFTGSTQVGKKLYKQCAATVKSLNLEMGGNAPFIVFGDADVKKAAIDVAEIKFQNCGQACDTANRILIDSTVYDSFLTALVEQAKKINVGDGLLKETTMGPMINQAAIDKVTKLVTNTIEKGANCLYGGNLSQENSLFFQPTVLSNVNENMDIFREEIFGPVAACYKFDNEEQAIQMANDTSHGLCAYFYTQNMQKSWRVARALAAGTVLLNTNSCFSNGPFGGYKQSGVGREGGVVNPLAPYLETKSFFAQL